MIVAPSYIPQPLVQVWLDAYTYAGGAESGQYAMTYALEVMRGIKPPPEGSSYTQSAIAKTYDQFFAGNRREDGTLRFTEEGYVAEKYAMQDVAASYGINPAIWESRYGELIGGDVDVNEFAQRIDSAYKQIIEQAPEVAKYYAENYGAQGLQPEDILVSFLDPDVGSQVLERNASVSLIGGTGAQYGFQLATTFAEQLLNAGLDTTDEGNQFFGQAREQLPILNVLAQRHNDPEDPFNIYDFTSAYLFNDPEQRRRMARLVAQEQAMFTGGTIGSARDRSGALTGLQAR